jgi:hypothetical protein
VRRPPPQGQGTGSNPPAPTPGAARASPKPIDSKPHGSTPTAPPGPNPHGRPASRSPAPSTRTPTETRHCGSSRPASTAGSAGSPPNAKWQDCPSRNTWRATTPCTDQRTRSSALAAYPSLRHVTDLLVSFVPGVPDFDEHVRLLTATAREVAPRLGWRPAPEGTP